MVGGRSRVETFPNNAFASEECFNKVHRAVGKMVRRVAQGHPGIFVPRPSGKFYLHTSPRRLTAVLQRGQTPKLLCVNTVDQRLQRSSSFHRAVKGDCIGRVRPERQLEVRAVTQSPSSAVRTT